MEIAARTFQQTTPGQAYYSDTPNYMASKRSGDPFAICEITRPPPPPLVLIQPPLKRPTLGMIFSSKHSQKERSKTYSVRLIPGTGLSVPKLASESINVSHHPTLFV